MKNPLLFKGHLVSSISFHSQLIILISSYIYELKVFQKVSYNSVLHLITLTDIF